MVYIGSPACAYSNDPALIDIIKSIGEELNTIATSNHGTLVKVGVAVSPSIADGLAYLDRYDSLFDEVVTGRSWISTGMVRYVLRDFVAQPTTPELVITTRTIGQASLNGETTWTVNDEAVVLRRSGIGAIRALLSERPELQELVTRKMTRLDSIDATPGSAAAWPASASDKKGAPGLGDPRVPARR